MSCTTHPIFTWFKNFPEAKNFKEVKDKNKRSSRNLIGKSRFYSTNGEENAKD
jgi:hypothetical protein